MKYFIKFFSLLLFITLIDFVNAQGLVLENNVNIVLKNNAFLVLGDSIVSTHIDTLNGGGQIISESENNTIRWYLGNDTGQFFLPFGTQTIAQGGNGIKIPLSFTINTAGNAGAYIDFSTYETSTDMNVPWPSTVSNMNAAASNNDNSLNVIDRFWKIDTDNYDTIPEMTLNFGYDTSTNEIGGGNTLLEGNLFAQNWNDSLQEWMPGMGIANTTLHIVQNVQTSQQKSFPFWTLVDNAIPLPIELLSFTATLIKDDLVQLDWQTASEVNNDYFTVERSKNAQDWSFLFEVDGQGNSNQVENYTIDDTSPLYGVSYYRLKQTDFDGSYDYSKIEIINNVFSASNIKVYPNPSNGMIYIQGEDIQQIELASIDGKRIRLNESNLNNGFIDLSNQANGVYIIKIKTTTYTDSYKILLKK